VRVAAGWIACASALAQAPDTILFNGRIVTLDARSSVHQALAIRDGRIVPLGTNAQMPWGALSCARLLPLRPRTPHGALGLAAGVRAAMFCSAH
jgi:hypothetical protein